MQQAGAIAFRERAGRLEVLLVSPRDGSEAGIFPKGHVEIGERPADTAVRELREEAGVHGVVVDAACPPLRFRSGSERVQVQYYIVAVTDEVGHGEGRARQWVPLEEVRDHLQHEDARALFERAAPQIVEASKHHASELDAGLRDLLLAEYAHAADSLLRNEEDGERRVRFFLSLAGAAGGIVVLVRGDGSTVTRADVVDPVLVVFAALLVAIGYVTFVRVVERNLASEGYKRGLNRIRRAFAPSAQDPSVVHLAFDPYGSICRRPPSWRSIGRGGWLETVALVEAVLLGGLAALVVPATAWLDALVAAVVAVGAWLGLIARARHRYRTAAG